MPNIQTISAASLYFMNSLSERLVRAVPVDRREKRFLPAMSEKTEDGRALFPKRLKNL